MNFKRFAAAVSAFAVILLGLLMLAGCAPKGEDQGGDALARIQAKGEITVALEGTWSPWTYHNEADELVDELIDRYGEPPKTVNNLISVALLRATAAQCRVKDIAQKGEKLVFTLDDFQLEPFSALCGQEKYAKRLVLIPGDSPRFSLRLAKNEDPLRAARHVVEDYARAWEALAG